MDELLKHALCSFGIVYLAVRVGQSATSLATSLVNGRASYDAIRPTQTGGSPHHPGPNRRSEIDVARHLPVMLCECSLQWP